jgi:hypothetical protein
MLLCAHLLLLLHMLHATARLRMHVETTRASGTTFACPRFPEAAEGKEGEMEHPI